MADKKEKHVTPVGIAKWAHLNTPKPAFAGDKGAKYQIDVLFDPNDAEWKEWGAKIKQMLADTKGKNSPFKQEKDQEDNPTGKWFVTFKTSEQFKPGLFDKYGKQISETVLIGNGSKVRVNYNPREYEGFGGGLALYLNAVQVLELVEYTGRSADAYGFDVAPEPAQEKKQPEDDLPF